MYRTDRASAWLGVLLLLSGCGLLARAEAVDAVQRFLAAVHAEDRAAFEAAIDRSALRQDLREQLADVGRSNVLEIDGGASDFALDRMITPRAFTLVEAGGGKPLADAPDSDQVRKLIRLSGSRHACVGPPDPNTPCVLSFAKLKGEWKLVGMRADQLTLTVDPAASK